jgi:hypothetical protein
MFLVSELDKRRIHSVRVIFAKLTVEKGEFSFQVGTVSLGVGQSSLRIHRSDILRETVNRTTEREPQQRLFSFSKVIEPIEHLIPFHVFPARKLRELFTSPGANL